MPTNGDPLVLSAQQWLNATYGNDSRYEIIPENGKTGWTTIYALTRALQIELGITNTADSFGPTTVAMFNSYYPTGIHQQAPDDNSEHNIYAIIQGALFCKGYATGVGTVTRHFYNGTGNAIKSLKQDAGVDATSSTVTLNIMRALLSMDYFYSYDTSLRTQNIQTIQRYLNANYESYIGGLIPCDGLYGRKTNKALIFAIQAEEGMPASVANGNFGPTTRNCCPTLPYNNVETNYYGNIYTSAKIEKFTKILNMGLYINEVGVSSFSTTLDSNSVRQFQNKYALPITGIANLTTWLSVFISSGDTSRSALACDCATILTTDKAQTLYNNGYRYVGRYLSGTAGGISKALTPTEIQIAFNAGLRIFPIQQSSANTVSYFTEQQGIADATSAYTYATNLGIPSGTIIYFAVDCDPQDTDITSNILPYFAKVNQTMINSCNSRYRIGIYGTRNACTRVSNQGYAVSSFVSDMSTGYSGNLGFTIPNNWAFDQFTTVTVGSGNGQIEIDKDGFSGRDTGFGNVVNSFDDPTITPEPDYSLPIGYDTNSPQPSIMLNMSNTPYNVYSSKEEGAAMGNPALQEINDICDNYGYTLLHPAETNLWGVEGNKVGEIKPGDLFVRFECRNHAYDNIPEFSGQVVNEGDSVHKVLFRTEGGTVRYGYIQEVLTADEYNLTDSFRYGRENFFYYNFNPLTNALETNNVSVSNAIYTVKRELNYIKSSDGSSLGTLPIGTQLKGPGNAGATHHGYMYFAYKRSNENEEWQHLDETGNCGAFVDLDMSNGVNGFDRALW